MPLIHVFMLEQSSLVFLCASRLLYVFLLLLRVNSQNYFKPRRSRSEDEMRWDVFSISLCLVYGLVVHEVYDKIEGLRIEPKQYLNHGPLESCDKLGDDAALVLLLLLSFFLLLLAEGDGALESNLHNRNKGPSANRLFVCRGRDNLTALPPARDSALQAFPKTIWAFLLFLGFFMQELPILYLPARLHFRRSPG